MFEKVNPSHPDKVADRVAGALVDLAYKKCGNPRIAVEVLLGHGQATVMIESSEDFSKEEVVPIVERIAGDMVVNLVCVKQDEHLAKNQEGAVRCGDNGIFKGAPITGEQETLFNLAKFIYEKHPYDGKYVSSGGFLDRKAVICQSNLSGEDEEDLLEMIEMLFCYQDIVMNPLGAWTGGPDVDCGATNRKLGSDMGDGVTGGGLHGKDLSKADVSVNIVCFLLANDAESVYTAICAIGDTEITFVDERGKSVVMKYEEVVKMAKRYIQRCGGFERFAEWGLIR